MIRMAPYTKETDLTPRKVQARINKLRKVENLAGWQEEFLNSIVNSTSYTQGQVDLITEMEKQYAASL